jgi:putative endopeptidase
MRGPADVQRMVRALHAIAVPVVFSFTATADAHDPGRTLGEVGAGGLGLPDRDSYLKTEPRFVTARAQYAAYLTQVLTLAGKPAAEAARLATMVFDVEKRLAIASLDNVALRNPKNTDHPTTMAELAALSPHLDWSAYFEEGRIARSGLNVAEPAFVQEVDRDLTSLPIDAWRAFSRRVSSARPRHGSPGPSPTRISASTSSSSPA